MTTKNRLRAGVPASATGRDGRTRPVVILAVVGPGRTPNDVGFDVRGDAGAPKVFQPDGSREAGTWLEPSYVVLNQGGTLAWVRGDGLVRSGPLRLVPREEHDLAMRSIEGIVALGEGERPDEEDYDDTESAYDNGLAVGTHDASAKAAELAARALRLLAPEKASKAPAPTATDILKVGLVTVVNGRVLVVRKRGGRTFILPGGKPKAGESEVETLAREVLEELGCAVDLDDPSAIGRFKAPAADLPGRTVTVAAYLGRLLGTPVASGEIEEVRWFRPWEDDMGLLATSISEQMLPRLVADGVLPGPETRWVGVHRLAIDPAVAAEAREIDATGDGTSQGTAWGPGKPIAEAKAGRPVLAWCDHEADPLHEDAGDGTGRTRLTTYAAHAEGLGHAPTGFHIVEWGGAWWEDAEGDRPSLPDWWFVKGGDFEVAANPVTFWELPPDQPGAEAAACG